LGLAKLRDRFEDPTMRSSFAGLFPTDSARNTRFAINFLTSIGLGVLSDGLRAHLKAAASATQVQATSLPIAASAPAEQRSRSTSTSSSSSSGSSGSYSSYSGSSYSSYSSSSRSTPQGTSHANATALGGAKIFARSPRHDRRSRSSSSDLMRAERR
jgi:pre-mRNA-splicing factor CWC22